MNRSKSTPLVITCTRHPGASSRSLVPRASDTATRTGAYSKARRNHRPAQNSPGIKFTSDPRAVSTTGFAELSSQQCRGHPIGKQEMSVDEIGSPYVFLG